MALILAAEMGVGCKITTAPSLERPRDIVGLLVNLKPGDVLFIDEIHRLSPMTEELLYPAMEDYRLDITIGKGKTARTRSIDLQPFTLVGATTRVGALTSPPARSLWPSTTITILRTRRTQPNCPTDRQIIRHALNRQWGLRNCPSFPRNSPDCQPFVKNGFGTTPK